MLGRTLQQRDMHGKKMHKDRMENGNKDRNKTEYVERTNHLLNILNQIVMIEIVVQSMTMTVFRYQKVQNDPHPGFPRSHEP